MNLQILDIVFIHDDPTPYEIRNINHVGGDVKTYRIVYAETAEFAGWITEHDVTDYIPHDVDQGLQREEEVDTEGLRPFMFQMMNDILSDASLSNELKKYRNTTTSRPTDMGTLIVSVKLEK